MNVSQLFISNRPAENALAIHLMQALVIFARVYQRSDAHTSARMRHFQRASRVLMANKYKVFIPDPPHPLRWKSP